MEKSLCPTFAFAFAFVSTILGVWFDFQLFEAFEQR